MKERVAVVIPYYHGQLNELEKVAFQQCVKVLQEFPIILVLPDTMEKSLYPTGYKFIYMRVPSKWMQSVSTYNRMMLDINFYKKFLEYEYILIYQLDAFVFRDELRHFCNLGFDYIGAPWPLGTRYVKNIKECMWYVGNGGLSLRNVEASILMLKKNPSDSWKREEDVYWATCNSEEFRVAPIEIARQFSIEQQVKKMYSLNQEKLPFGCHAWEKMDFLFWKPFFEKEGYSLSSVVAGNWDKEHEKDQEDILEIPCEIVRRGLLKLVHKEKAEVFVWGAGTIGKEMVLLLRHSGLPVRCVDSNKDYSGEYLWDVCIELPDILKEAGSEIMILIAVKKYKDGIKEQLLKMGFYHGKHVFYYSEVHEAIWKLWKEEKHKVV